MLMPVRTAPMPAVPAAAPRALFLSSGDCGFCCDIRISDGEWLSDRPVVEPRQESVVIERRIAKTEAAFLVEKGQLELHGLAVARHLARHRIDAGHDVGLDSEIPDGDVKRHLELAAIERDGVPACRLHDALIPGTLN